jgi:hypothetical protein
MRSLHTSVTPKQSAGETSASAKADELQPGHARTGVVDSRAPATEVGRKPRRSMPGCWGGRRIRSSAPHDKRSHGPARARQSGPAWASSSRRRAMLAPQSHAIQTIRPSTPASSSPKRRWSAKKTSSPVRAHRREPERTRRHERPRHHDDAADEVRSVEAQHQRVRRDGPPESDDTEVEGEQHDDGPDDVAPGQLRVASAGRRVSTVVSKLRDS